MPERPERPPSPQRWRRVESLLSRALELDAEERGPFLAGECGDDRELRREVEGLLAADADAPSFLDRDAAPFAAAALETPSRAAGERLGPYRIVRQVGSGGMGRVFLAERLEEFEQQVAVKLLSHHVSPELRSRFHAERQILAGLSHPHIAQVLDGGDTDDGVPYLVMEYVDGLPISTYCERNRLGLEPRLRLFGDVCAAVDHAHRHLVVHRDLKPSNVLVTAEGHVKLLDFGIAKLLAAEATQLTRQGVLLMTPEYAAPEQIRHRPISTATDVYALGMMLYEVLTGSRPYEIEDKTPAEMERVICELEPETASRRATQAPDLPRRWASKLRGDLDTIVAKALRKQPEDRYTSAGALASDLERFEEGLPVEARPATWHYRTVRFISRHRWGVASAAALSLLVLVSVVLLAFQQAATASERDRAQLEAERSIQVTEFLIDLFDANDPARAKGEDPTASKLLSRGVERAQALADQPLVHGHLLQAMGRALHVMGRDSEAEAVLERALAVRRAELGEDHPEVARTLNQLAETWIERDDFKRAEELAQRAVTIVRQHPEEEDLLALALVNQGSALLGQRRWERGAEILEEGLEIQLRRFGNRDLRLTPTLNSLASALMDLGRLDEAEQHLRRALDMHRSAGEEVHPTVVVLLHHLGGILRRTEREQEALAVMRRAIELSADLYGEDSLHVHDRRASLALLLRSTGEYDEAEQLYRQVLAARRRLVGESSPTVAGNLYNLAKLLHAREDYAGAEAALLEALAINRRHEPEPLTSGIFRTGLGLVLLDAERPGEAEAQLELALELLRLHFPSGHERIADALVAKAEVLLALGRLDEARLTVEDALELRRSHHSEGHWKNAEAQAVLGAVLGGLGDREAAALHLRQAQQVLAGKPAIAERARARCAEWIDTL